MRALSGFESVVETQSYVVFIKMSGLAAFLFFGYLEARKLDIPLVSMLDTNCDPDLCDVPIPCNDDAVRSVQLVLGRLADAINEGRHGAQDRGGDDEG